MTPKHHKDLDKNMYDNIALLYLHSYFFSITKPRIRNTVAFYHKSKFAAKFLLVPLVQRMYYKGCRICSLGSKKKSCMTFQHNYFLLIVFIPLTACFLEPTMAINFLIRIKMIEIPPVHFNPLIFLS